MEGLYLFSIGFINKLLFYEIILLLGYLEIYFWDIFLGGLIMVQELTDKTFQSDVLSSKTPVIVDFWASWCGPCKMLTPVFEDVSSEYRGKLNFAKISTENYPEIAAENGVTGIPCLIVFHKGEEVDRIVGFMPKPALKQKIDAILSRL